MKLIDTDKFRKNLVLEQKIINHSIEEENENLDNEIIEEIYNWRISNHGVKVIMNKIIVVK